MSSKMPYNNNFMGSLDRYLNKNVNQRHISTNRSQFKTVDATKRTLLRSQKRYTNGVNSQNNSMITNQIMKDEIYKYAQSVAASQAQTLVPANRFALKNKRFINESQFFNNRNTNAYKKYLQSKQQISIKVNDKASKLDRNRIGTSVNEQNEYSEAYDLPGSEFGKNFE